MDKELLQSFNNLSVALQNLAETLQRNSERTEATGSSIADAVKDMNIGEQLKAINDNLKKVVESNTKIIDSQVSLTESVAKIKEDNDTYQKQLIDTQVILNESIAKINEENKNFQKQLIDTQVILNESIAKINEENKNFQKQLIDTQVILSESVAKAIDQNTEIQKQQIDSQTMLNESISKINENINNIESKQSGIQNQTNSMVKKISEKQVEDSKKIESTAELVKKKKEEGGPNFLPDKDQKQTITDGVKMVVLIAAGVLAIGLAFKLIGQVNFVSVIALALALPLVAIAFERIAKIKVDVKDMAVTLGALIAFSVAAVATSFILSQIKTISIQQALTVMLIGTSMVGLSYAMKIFSNNISGIETKSFSMMPLVMITASLAITLSSFILAKVQEISIGQAATIVMISAAFAILSVSLNQLTKNFVDISIPGLLRMPLVLISASFAIMVSSFILTKVQTITIPQALTVIMISAAFALLSYNIAEMTDNFTGINLPGLIIMPLVLVASSFAIMLSSYILSAVRPVGILQLLTSIAIAAVFAVISFGLLEISKAVGKINPLEAAMIPLVMVAMAISIAAASEFLKQVHLITFSQFLTSVGIAIVFIPISFALPFIARAVKMVDIATAMVMPLVLIPLAFSIMASSHILAMTRPIETGLLFNIVLQSLTLSVISIAMAGTVWVMDKLGMASRNGVQKAFYGGMVVLTIATTIFLASHILANGNYTTLPSLSWILLSTASILVYGLLIGVVGTIISFIGAGTSAKAILAGSLAILAIAGTIWATSHILASGDYTKFPTLSWTLQTAASILAYGILVNVVGALILMTGGIGAGILALGAVAIIGIAATILAVEKIFAEGDYQKYPSMNYTMNTLLIIGGFGLIMAASGLMLPLILLGYVSVRTIASSIAYVNKILSEGDYTKMPSLQYVMSTVLLLGGFAAIMIASGAMIIPIMLGKISMEKIAESIIEVDKKLAEGNYTKFPDKNYVLSVGAILAAYGAVMIMAGAALPIIWMGKKSVTLIAEGIRDSSHILAQGNYTSGPSLQWSEGVSKAIGAFSEVYKTLTTKGALGFIFGGEGSSPEKMKQAIITISDGIITAAAIFSQSSANFVNGPPVKWSEGVGKAIGAFAPVYATLTSKGIMGALFGGGGSSPEKMAKAIETISYGIIASAGIFAKNKAKFENPPPVAWGRGVGKAIKAFAPVFDYLNKGSFFSFTEKRIGELILSIVGVSRAIIASARTFDESGVKYSNYPTEEWSKGVKSALMGFSPVMKWVSENSGWFSADAEDLQETIVAMAQSITSSADILSRGNYNLNVPETFGTNMFSLFQGYMKIVEMLSPVTGFFSKLGTKIEDMLGMSGSTPETVAQNIVNMSNILAGGNYNNVIPEGYMQSVYQNIQEFLRISDLLQGIESEDKLFEFNITASNGIAKMASDYEKLATSVQNLSTAIASIEIEKIAALKSLTANVVLLSLMDPNQFDEMMKKFEEKSAVLGDVFSQLAEQGNEIEQPMVRQAAAPETGAADLKTVVGLMSQMDRRLAQIASNSSNLSSYVNELRTSGERVSMRK